MRKTGDLLDDLSTSHHSRVAIQCLIETSACTSHLSGSGRISCEALREGLCALPRISRQGFSIDDLAILYCRLAAYHVLARVRVELVLWESARQQESCGKHDTKDTTRGRCPSIGRERQRLVEQPRIAIAPHGSVHIFELRGIVDCTLGLPGRSNRRAACPATQQNTLSTPSIASSPACPAQQCEWLCRSYVRHEANPG